MCVKLFSNDFIISYHSGKGNILDKWAHIKIKMNYNLDCIFSFVDRLCLRER